MLSRSFYCVLASRTFAQLSRSKPFQLIPSFQSSFSSRPYAMSEFKLKDLTSLNLKNGDKIEAEVEGVEGGKVLLIKLSDKVHAMNANCTHYGAPLKNGVLTPEGRLTCPWHGGQSVHLIVLESRAEYQ
jgi:nitrite reductase/ring-hydroxylating ferredoxin subunit